MFTWRVRTIGLLGGMSRESSAVRDRLGGFHSALPDVEVPVFATTALHASAAVEFALG